MASAEATARYDSSMNVTSASGLLNAVLTPSIPFPQPRSTTRSRPGGLPQMVEQEIGAVIEARGGENAGMARHDILPTV